MSVLVAAKQVTADKDLWAFIACKDLDWFICLSVLAHEKARRKRTIQSMSV
jgi:hypothetical protein